MACEMVRHLLRVLHEIDNLRDTVLRADCEALFKAYFQRRRHGSAQRERKMNAPWSGRSVLLPLSSLQALHALDLSVCPLSQEEKGFFFKKISPIYN
jgi:hypothetical protein